MDDKNLLCDRMSGMREAVLSNETEVHKCRPSSDLDSDVISNSTVKSLHR
jgi:hypothetical protein